MALKSQQQPSGCDPVAPDRAQRWRRRSLLALTVWGALSLDASTALAQNAAAGTRLYALQTNCTVRGVEQRCEVEAFDGSNATVYRTTINGARTSFRLVDTPNRRSAQLWNGDSRSRTALSKLSLDFETSTLCLNGEALCLVNPNYFASLRQSYPELRSDRIVARFEASTGQLSAICYSREACDAGF